jgi:acyl-CoA synthetase (AMP-forming)/AMP-acid ligase II
MIQNGLTVLLGQGTDHRDSFLSTTPLTHAASGTRIFSLATDGLKHVIMESFDVAGFFELVARERITTTILVPTMLADVVDSPLLGGADLSSMRFIIYGAAPTPEPLIARALEALPCGLFQGYGLTEGSPALTAFTPEEHQRFRTSSDPAVRRRLRSMGRPVPGVRAKIVGDDGAPVAVGEPGELHVRSTKTMLGYWGSPELTAGAFVDGWLATGDVCEADDEGYLFLVDRKKEMLISGGFNVYPSEIERVLRDHAAVREAAVVGTAHERWGEVPVAFVALRADTADAAVVLDELRAMCRDQLAGYKQPRDLRVVDALPRNETGKIHKPTLRTWAAGDG